MSRFAAKSHVPSVLRHLKPSTILRGTCTTWRADRANSVPETKHSDALKAEEFAFQKTEENKTHMVWGISGVVPTKELKGPRAGDVTCKGLTPAKGEEASEAAG